jgi:hypothetical protein
MPYFQQKQAFVKDTDRGFTLRFSAPPTFSDTVPWLAFIGKLLQTDRAFEHKRPGFLLFQLV